MVDLPITKWIKTKIRRLIGIVEDTDVATHSIALGKYVVWKGDLYKSTAAIAVGGSLSLSNLSPVSDGGINELSEHMGNVKIYKYEIDSFTLPANTSLKIIGGLSSITNGVVTNANFVSASLTFLGVAAVSLLDKDGVFYLYAVAASPTSTTAKLSIVFFYK